MFKNMFTNHTIKNLSRFSRYMTKQIKYSFPSKQDSIKKLEQKQYKLLANDFPSYGSFINYCISNKISLISSERREIYNNIQKKISHQKFFKNKDTNLIKNTDLNDYNFSSNFWKMSN